MIALQSKITIDSSLEFNKLVECSVNSSFDTITTTAKVVLQNAFDKENRYVKDEITKGQDITFELGYSPTITSRFIGYISKLNLDSPFTVMAEDEAWILKQKTITKYSKKDLTVKTLIADLLAELGITLTTNIIDAEIGTWAVQNMTIIAVLNELKSKFGFRSFFRNGELFIGYPNLLSTEFPTKYGNGSFVFYFDGDKADIISHSLEWKDINDISQVIKGTLIQKDNTQKTKYAYYLNGVATLTETQPAGNMITRFQYDISQKDMDSYLLEELPLIVYTGYHGSFTTFGDSIAENQGGLVQHGDTIELKSKKSPEKDGKYVVKSVNLYFGINGYRQTIELYRQA
jgi:hypothetical protein